MTLMETIVQGVQNLPLRDQIKVAQLIYQLDAGQRQRRAEILQRTYGALSESEGEAFERAINESSRTETRD